VPPTTSYLISTNWHSILLPFLLHLQARLVDRGVGDRMRGSCRCASRGIGRDSIASDRQSGGRVVIGMVVEECRARGHWLWGQGVYRCVCGRGWVERCLHFRSMGPDSLEGKWGMLGVVSHDVSFDFDGRKQHFLLIFVRDCVR
jgi:hypothetical protein